MSSLIERAMVIISGLGSREPLRLVEDLFLRPNTWKRSCNPVERFVIETADALATAMMLARQTNCASP